MARTTKIRNTSDSTGTELPKHVQLSVEELAIMARLIRVLREPSYWLGAFIDWALQAEMAAYPEGLKVAVAKKMLEDISGLESWAAWFEQAPLERSPILRYCGHRYFKNDVDRMQACEADALVSGEEEEQFYEVVRQWRIEHPEPPKPQRFPAGHLGREESGD